MIQKIRLLRMSQVGNSIFLINFLREDFFVDYIPPVKEYFQDQKFIN